jgi:hypothetical protein
MDASAVCAQMASLLCALRQARFGYTPVDAIKEPVIFA